MRLRIILFALGRFVVPRARTQRKTIVNLLLLATACAFSLVGPNFAHAGKDHLSRVFLVAADAAYETVLGDVDGTSSVIGMVGQPFNARIDYEIGWSTWPDGGGSYLSHESDISNPEYEWFTHSTPPGLSRIDNVIKGTPTRPGQWKIWPAVRDTNKGERPYRGQGVWWTTFRNWDGKTWSQAQDPTPIVILPPLTGKEFRLQCAFAASGEKYILEIDYENKLVKVIGNNGRIAGAYNVAIDSDIIGWNKMSLPTARGAYLVVNASLDRKTGQWTILAGPQGMTRTMTADCEKRSQVQKF